MRQRLVSLRRDERGTTLVELLTAVMIGTIVLMIGFALLDLGTKSQAKTADRLDTLSRGRIGMELINQRIRSAVCGEDTSVLDTETGAAFLVADPNEVVFRSSLATDATATTVRPSLRRISLSDGNVVEAVFAPTNTRGTPAYGNYPATPSTTRVLLAGVRPEAGRSGIFEYLRAGTGVDEGRDIAFAYDDPKRFGALKVRVRLAATPRRADSKATAFRSTVMTYTDDPTDTDQVPQCAP